MSSGASSPKGRQSDHRWILPALALLFLVIGLRLLLQNDQSLDLASRSPEVNELPADKSVNSQRTLDKINLEMQKTEQSLLDRRREVQEQNERLEPLNNNANDWGVGAASRTNNPAPGLTFDKEDSAAKVYRDLRPGQRPYDTPYLPDQNITSILEKSQWMSDYDRKQREAYIRAFIKNAEAAGYRVIINDKLEVISIQRAPSNQHPLKFPLSDDQLSGGAAGAR